MEYLDVTLKQGPFSEDLKVEDKALAYFFIFLAAVGIGTAAYFALRKK